MKIIEVVIDGEYTIEKYDNGTINQYLTPVPIEYTENEQPLSESEQMQIETYLNSCFIADMMTLNG